MNRYVTLAVIKAVALAAVCTWLLADQTSQAYADLDQRAVVGCRDGQGSTTDLVEAIGEANNERGPNVIELPAACEFVFEFAQGQGGDAALPIVEGELTIIGHGSMISRGDLESFRLFELDHNAVVTMTDMTLRNGDAQRGGAILAGPNSELTMRGIRLLGNHAQFEGGAIVAESGSRLILEDVVLQSNRAANGGALMFKGETLVLTRTQVLSNVAQTSAGIVALSEATAVRISGSHFERNEAAMGAGAGAAILTELELSNTHFISNSIASINGAGGALLVTKEFTDTGSIFLDNRAYVAGAIALQNADAVLINTQVISNVSLGDGGGIYATGALTLYDPIIVGNHAVEDGGGITYVGPSFRIIGGLVSKNRSQELGGGLALNGSGHIDAVHFAGNSADVGGAVAAAGSLHMSNNHLANNDARVGAALHLLLAAETVPELEASLVNNVFSNHRQSAVGPTSAVVCINCRAQAGGGQTTLAHNTFFNTPSPQTEAQRLNGVEIRVGSAVVRNNIFVGFQTGLLASGSDIIESVHNLFFANRIDEAGPVLLSSEALRADPRFVNAALSDYRLMEGSPAIDSGILSALQTDIEGTSRPQGEGFDRGAYEFAPRGEPVEDDRPIVNLTAKNDGPTELGNATSFAAEMDQGDNVTFIWDFGDGHRAGGAQPQHVYGAAGTYSTMVTASNGAGTQTAETTVIVNSDPDLDSPIINLQAHNDGPVLVGQPVTLVASVTGGSGITYRWLLDDGAVQEGAVIDHTYDDSGNFVAQVTAINDRGSATAETVVVVRPRATENPDGQSRLFLPFISR